VLRSDQRRPIGCVIDSGLGRWCEARWSSHKASIKAFGTGWKRPPGKVGRPGCCLAERIHRSANRSLATYTTLSWSGLALTIGVGPCFAAVVRLLLRKKRGPSPVKHSVDGPWEVRACVVAQDTDHTSKAPHCGLRPPSRILTSTLSQRGDPPYESLGCLRRNKRPTQYINHKRAGLSNDKGAS
jgi:hypothetical protein